MRFDIFFVTNKLKLFIIPFVIGNVYKELI